MSEAPIAASGAVLNPTRERRFRMGALQMLSDEHELPYEQSEAQPAGTWIGLGAFAGNASQLEAATGKLGTPTAATSEGMTALTVVGGRVLAIVAPESGPSVWLAAPLSSLKVETAGQQGVFGKRPQSITLSTDDWDLHLRTVSRLTRPMSPKMLGKTNSRQGGKEDSLVAAIS